MERKLVLRAFALAALASGLAFAPVAHGAPKAGPTGKTKTARVASGVKNVYGDHGGPVSWCAEELETLPNGLCYIKGAEPERRTLVIFLHGMIAEGSDWQWLQERALLRQAKASKFDAIFAKAPLGEQGAYAWPGSAKAQAETEAGLVDGWSHARAFLEKRSGHAYDEVFVMGFSSGAYYTSSLALRGRVKADGFAVFAGGAGVGGAPSPEARPVFVGVCADDPQTAQHSRGFGAALAARGFPYKVEEQHVGHMFGDAHVMHAVAWLRGQQKR